MNINQYVNGFQQFILLASKEVEQDGELNSIEISYHDYTQQNTIIVSK